MPTAGDGSVRRCIVHVTDVAQAVVAVLQRGRDGEAYNIGSRNEHTILQVLTKMMTAVEWPNTVSASSFPFSNANPHHK